MKKDEPSIAVASVSVDVAPGDLLDRITILEIKSARLKAESALHNVRTELATLHAARDRTIPFGSGLNRLTAELRQVNEALWDLEEAVRRREASGDFGEEFVQSARSIIHANDRRAAIKQAINRRLGASFLDEKSFPLSDPAADIDSSSTRTKAGLSMLGETKRKRHPPPPKRVQR